MTVAPASPVIERCFTETNLCLSRGVFVEGLQVGSGTCATLAPSAWWRFVIWCQVMPRLLKLVAFDIRCNGCNQNTLAKQAAQ
jgi:hypothetical protein